VAAVTGAAAGQAPGIVQVRLSGATADVEMLATLLADYAGSGIDVIERTPQFLRAGQVLVLGPVGGQRNSERVAVQKTADQANR
jgi:uncharacterized caspase-like protein